MVASPHFHAGWCLDILKRTTRDFLAGGIFWYNKPMSLPGSQALYTILSLVLLIAVLPALWPRFSNVPSFQRQALQLSMACFVAILGFFVLMSIRYDFHDSYNPSRWRPFFCEGRLLLGALIPFLVLFVYGWDRMLRRFGNSAKFAVLGSMILIMLAVEIVTDWPVFSNPYNWYHLP